MPKDQQNTQGAKPGDARMDVQTEELDVDGQVKGGTNGRPISVGSKQVEGEHAKLKGQPGKG